MAKFVDGEPDSVNNVVTSLILRNVASRMSAANNYVIVDKMPLAVASELFMCNFHLFESDKGNRTSKTLEYTLDLTLPNRFRPVHFGSQNGHFQRSPCSHQ
ncbi:hypothetical protein CAOG_009252 [Capsaspora owczarzaki ATCC 30864]|uniref:Uncharacterized protein n=1 Tax=Capsaspora owczarzaki (strain ATCC 30864) TaxID=595528 RepID=A0A0D2WG59_CAPO3|nr:hypothetical protein CAOG_009252 [Capsaspora owczarzaki ATCC 30864]